MGFKPGQSGNPAGKPKGATNKTTREIKAFARKFLESKDYVASAMRRMTKGKAPHLEVLWHHYAFGKPRETVRIDGEVPPFVLILQDDDHQP
jgi:hypothetical protein